MVNNPLLVAWPNQANVIASSRKASARTYPQVSTDVSYKILAGSGANATHWTLNALAKGASAWGTTKLDPQSSAVPFAYAQSASPPTNPADVASRFSIHQSRGKWSHDLASGRIANFGSAVEQLSKTSEAK